MRVLKEVELTAGPRLWLSDSSPSSDHSWVRTGFTPWTGSEASLVVLMIETEVEE